jgi:two-component system sensor histidine kinase YesM
LQTGWTFPIIIDMKITEEIHKKFNNFSLNKKFTCIICFVLAMTALGTGTGLWCIYHSGNLLLYEATKESSDYSSSAIAERLSNTVDMTGMILADNSIQDLLSVASDSQASDNDKSKAFRTLSYVIPDYYQNFRQNGIYYINLYNPSYVTYSNPARCRDVPPEITKALLAAAHEHPGDAIWVTDYCEEYGLFLVRDVRRAKDFQLDTIGTILVNINLNEVIQNSAGQVFDSAPPLYIIYKEGKEIYHSPQLENQAIPAISRAADYGTIGNPGSSCFFYTRGTIPEFGWDYLCLRPNDSVVQARLLSLFLSLSVIGLTLFASLLFSRKMFLSISRHFYRLLSKMNQFGKDEPLSPSREFDYSGRTDEIGALHQGFDQMARQVQELIQKNYVNELLTKEMQLKALENQINPHFLYNTLESINSYAKAIEAEPISRMVEALGSLLRITLSKSTAKSVIESEVGIVKDYMAIIQVRFGDRVQYELSIPEELYHTPIPRLTLQPLVENAINYALEEIIGTFRIQITGKRENGMVILTVSNNGSQFPDNVLENLETNQISPHGFGIGLLNINKRIKLQFGEAYGLHIYNVESEDLAVVQIRLPEDQKDV